MERKLIGLMVYVLCGLFAMYIADTPKLKEFHDIILFICGYFTCKICQCFENEEDK